MAKPPDSLNLALQHQKAGRVDQAEQIYRQILEQQPDYVDALNLLGALIYQQGKFQEAVSCFERVLTLQPDNPDSYNSMGVVLKGQGKAKEAVNYYRQALTMRPNQPEVHNNLGNALRMLGDLEGAIAAYEQALALKPDYPEAHNNLGAMLKDQGRLEEALTHCQTAIALKPDYAEAFHNLGATLHRQGKLEETLQAYRQALALKPNYPEVCNSLGNVLQQQGNYDGAIAYHRQAIALKPNLPEAFHSLANAFQQQKKLEDAINYYQQALTLRPDYPEALSNFGNALQEQGKLEEAIAHYQRALELRPNFAEAHSNLGAALKEQHKLEDAIAHFQEAIAIRPDYAEVYNNLGNAYQEQDRIDEAIACYRKALELKPDFPEIHSNLGNMLQQREQFEAAFEQFRLAIAAQPEYAGAYNNLGIALRNSGQIHAAFDAYAKAIDLDPDFVEAHWNTALNYLLIGDLKQGFAQYEWRLKWSRFQQQSPPRPYSQPRWDGANLKGKTLFLYAEQGLGDTIQFVRYIPLLANQGIRVILECQPQLISLLKTLPGLTQIIPHGSPPPIFDAHAHLMSLPAILGTTLETIPAQVPYLPLRPTPHPPLPTPHSPPPTFKIGIVWSGNPDNPYNRTRQIPLERLLSLAKIPGISLYSLQKDVQDGDLALLQAHPEIPDLRTLMTDFVATAALIEQLDLVISVDTAVTHLAGALGRPVWLLLPFSPDWRWMIDRNDSPWYPTMQLFRQPTHGNWDTVIAQVQAALPPLLTVERSSGNRPIQGTTGRKGKGANKKSKQAGKSPRNGSSPETIVPVSVALPEPPIAATTANIPEGLKVAVRLHQKGQVREAEQVCHQFLQQHEHPEAWHMLGLIAHQERRFEAAIAHYQKVLALNPNHHDTCNNLAVALHELNRIDEAIIHYQRALALKPSYADAHNNYANALRAKGKLAEAIHHYRQAIAHRPNYPDAYNNLGLALYEQENFQQAATAYRQAIAQRPHFAQAHNHLGNALKELGEFAEAAVHYERAIALNPDYAKAYNNWGNIFRDTGDLTTAVQYYDRAIGIDANFAEAHWNKALTLLIGGDLKQGFTEYEWRWRVKLPTFQPMRSFAAPLWEGSPLHGKTIFLHAEQGMGDVIQFCRYATLVSEMGGRVILECHPPLINLLKGLTGVHQIVSYGSPPPPCDIHAPLLSLPHILGTTLETVPNQVPYLTPHPSPLTLLPTPHSPLPTLKVGIVWSGNPDNPYNRTRAVPLAQLLTLLDIPGVQFYSLQKDVPASDRDPLQTHPDIIDLRDQLTDFVHTAHLINQLDLVISIDTAVTHLAGSLGKPTWLLLPFAPDWRWLLEREDSPWYPTMRLFRQPAFGDWESVIGQVREVLVGWGKGSQGVRSQESGVRSQGGGIKPSQSNSNRQKTSPTAHPSPPIPYLPLDRLLESALTYYKADDLINTEQICQQILQQQPDQVEALNILGVVQARLGRTEAAIAHFQQVLQFCPDFADAWCNLGNVFKEAGNQAEALTHYQRAIALNPDHIDALHNLSVLLQELNCLEEALTHCQYLTQLQPNLAAAYYTLGYILRRLGRLDEAIASYQQALQRSPDYPEAHKNLGHALLLKGDLAKGFTEYEWRWRQQNWAPRPFAQPLWDGSSLDGKTILLHAEQGMGDTLHFIRYAQLVKARGGQVIVECQAPLLRLLQTTPGIDQLIPQDAPLPAFDTHAPLLSLPHILGTTLETIPTPIPYLSPPTPLPLPLPLTAPFKIGIVWTGNPDHRNNQLRSCQLAHFQALANIPGVAFYSLQKGDAVSELQSLPDGLIQDLSGQLHDFADTAAAIAQLDLVITIDTAVAHLTGALGKPVWLLLHHSPDWRWMLNRDDSPWYPTMRLFRQPQLGDWETVFATVRSDLIRKVNSLPTTGKTANPAIAPALESLMTGTMPNIPIGIGWQLDLVSDWGILGAYLALQLLQANGGDPVALMPAASELLPPLYRALLRSALTQTVPPAAAMLRLQAWGNCQRLPDVGQSPPQGQTVGMVCTTNTHYTPAAIAQAKTWDRLITGSTWNADLLKSHGLQPHLVPFQGIDPTLFHPGPKAHWFGDRFVVFVGGERSYARGQDIAIAAFKRFYAQHGDALLVTAWYRQDGSEPQNRPSPANDWLSTSGLPETAFIDLGMVPYPQLGQVLREANVALFPSRCEAGMNQVAIASLACGVPTILSANTGHLDLIYHNLGYPLHSQRPVKGSTSVLGMASWGESDVEEIVDTLAHIYTNTQEASYRGAIAADFIKDRTWKNQMQPLLKLLLNNNNPG